VGRLDDRANPLGACVRRDAVRHRPVRLVPSGAIVDLIAVIVLALIAWSIWRDRRALF
jgi:hypothetical protein